MSSDELPREKLVKNGRSSLTDEELIAIFLRTGIRGCNVLELAAGLKRNAGSLVALGRMEASEIMAQCRGIGLAKAATLAAVFELGHRAAREEHKSFVLDGGQSVYDYFIDRLRFEQQERVFAMMLSTRRELLRCTEVGCGTLTRVLIHPRDVFRDAIRVSAASLVLVHNHPGGNPKPSKQDDQLTEQIARAGAVMCIPLLDHIIIGAPGNASGKAYFSYREQGKLPLSPDTPRP